MQKTVQNSVTCAGWKSIYVQTKKPVHRNWRQIYIVLSEVFVKIRQITHDKGVQNQHINANANHIPGVVSFGQYVLQ